MTLTDKLRDEFGPYDKRPTSLLYREWAHKAGVRVRGEHDNPKGGKAVPEAARLAIEEGVWPLQLVNAGDKEHLAVLHALFHRLPHAMEYYLDQARVHQSKAITFFDSAIARRTRHHLAFR